MRNYFDAILSAVDDAKMELEDCESTIAYQESEIARKDKAYKLLDKKCEGLMDDNHELTVHNRRLVKQVNRLMDALAVVCSFHQVEGLGPISSGCPARLIGLSCGEMTDSEWKLIAGRAVE